MKLDCVITSCNDNPMYMNFIPLFIQTWKKLYNDVDIKIIFISTSLPTFLQPYSDYIVMFEPLNISTAFTSQYIRLLYPCITHYENGVMITDIDMLPMNNKYYSDNIKLYDNSKFIYLRNVLLESKQIAMCYNVATPCTWRSIFNINNIDDIKSQLIERFNSIIFSEGAGNNGWFTDQIDLYDKVYAWNKNTNNLIILNDRNTGYNRLDRIHIRLPLTPNIINNIKNHVYSDYHCLRPYDKYKHINDEIFNYL